MNSRDKEVCAFIRGIMQKHFTVNRLVLNFTTKRFLSYFQLIKHVISASYATVSVRVDFRLIESRLSWISVRFQLTVLLSMCSLVLSDILLYQLFP